MRQGLGLKFLFAAIAAVPASAIASPCATKGVDDAVVRRVSAREQKGMSLIMSMAMLPKIEKLSYETFLSGGSSCERGRFEISGMPYDFIGENEDKGAPRRALSAQKGAPVAALIPVVDLLAALTSPAGNHTAPNAGYLLITVTKEMVTGWRLYSAIPADAVLQADMEAALAGRLRFIFQTDTNAKKISITPD